MIELKATNDISVLMSWREEVIRHVFGQKPDECLLEANRRYYAAHISDGSHIAFVATSDGYDAGCGAMCLSEELPSPDNPSGRCAYLMNIYVREKFRKKGIAHHLLRRLIDEAKSRNCNKIYLESTAEGRSVYESSGFQDMAGMMKYHFSFQECICRHTSSQSGQS